MNTLAGIVVIALCGAALPAAAQDVRPATPTQVSDMLQGCWESEWTVDDPYSSERVCFGPSDLVSSTRIMGGPQSVEGFSVDGTFYFHDQKLHLRAPLSDGWIFATQELECDLVIRREFGMKLLNCVGSNPDLNTPDHKTEAVADSSYEWSPGGQ